MSTGGDDIERLLREIDAAGAGGSPAGGGRPAERTPAPRGERSPAKAGGKDVEAAKSRGGRLAFAVAAAVAVGIVGAVTGMVLGPILGWLPLLDFGFWSTGLGAAFGAFVTALVAGPPRWFSS